MQKQHKSEATERTQPQGDITIEGKPGSHHIEKVYHFNCGTLEPVGLGAMHAAKSILSSWPHLHSEFRFSSVKNALQTGGEQLFQKPRLVTHACALQTTEGIVLIDAGFSEEFLCNKSSFGHRQRIYNVQEGESAALVNQLKKHGLRPQDVRHIVLTHLDFDHASGCFDFPQAAIHVMHDEWLAATTPKTVFEKIRYGYEINRIRPRIRAHSQFVGTRWFGFPAIQPVPELTGLCMIPLPGHTRGHCGVAFSHSADAMHWTLHCGDAYIERKDLDHALGSVQNALPRPFDSLKGLHFNAGLALHQNRNLAETSLKLLRNLPKAVKLISTHAPEDFTSC